MAVNWFEGGRRISNLSIGVVIAVGVAAVFMQSDPYPVLSTRGPTMPWFVSTEACPENAYVRDMWDANWGGPKRGLRLCYLPLQNGKIPYAVAPTPPDEIKKQEIAKREREQSAKKGVVMVVVPESPWFYSAYEYDERVQSYVESSISTIKITPQLSAELRESLLAERWRNKWSTFKESLPWVMGFCLFIWGFTFIVGWIVRGFAGIPAGHDFRQAPKQD